MPRQGLGEPGEGHEDITVAARASGLMEVRNEDADAGMNYELFIEPHSYLPHQFIKWKQGRHPASTRQDRTRREGWDAAIQSYGHDVLAPV